MGGCHTGWGSFKGPDLPPHGESQPVERKEVSNVQRVAEIRSIEKYQEYWWHSSPWI